MRANGSRIRRARLEQGMSQVELSEIAKVDVTNISRIERGHTGARMATLRRLVKVLNLEMCDVIPEIDELRRRGA